MRASILIITLLALAFLITPALADDVTVPVNKDYQFSNGMVVHFDKLVIADNYHGTGYSTDLANTKWYDLYFTYENKGNKAQTGYLEVSLYDDKGNKYPSGKNITDNSMTMQPGSKSDTLRLIEVPVIPKDTKIQGFRIYDGFQSITFDIAGGQTSTPATPTGGQSTASKGPCAIALVLPLMVVGVIIVSRMKR